MFLFGNKIFADVIRSYYTKVGWTLRRRQWHPTPVLLPGKSHGQRSLVGCSPWGLEESDTIERLDFHFSLSCIGEELTTHSSVLAWRIPGTGEPGWLLSTGSHRVGHDWGDLAAAAGWTLSPTWLVSLQEGKGQTWKTPYDKGGREWSHAATSPGMPEVSRSWKRWERILL